MLGSENILIKNLKDKTSYEYELRHKYSIAKSRPGKRECDEENTGNFERCVDDFISRTMKCRLPWINDEGVYVVTYISVVFNNYCIFESCPLRSVSAM